MTLDEVDNALEELETRLERLRALYEQYFLGFEKIEPTVPRKDVDRRIYVLRREKIRNTGKRFKLQTLIQRYNTFQQYWMRVCREIENGTYRRHLARIERQMNPDKQLTIATRRRFGRAMALAQQAAAEANGAPPEEFEELSSNELEPASVPGSRRATPASSAPPAFAPRPVAARPLSPAPPRAPEAKTSDRPSRPPEERSFESLELDMGFLGSWVPPALDGAPPPKAAPPPKPGAAARTAPAAKSSPKAAPPPVRPAAPPPRPAAATPPPRPPAANPPPRPAAAAPPPAKPVEAAPAAAAPKPKSSPRAAPPPKPAQNPPPKPAAAAAPEPPRAVADERVKELHKKLLELKRQNKESGTVSLEGLAKTLRDTETKLRAQHKNRKIEFDVVIRDGKAIVKPTVR